MTRPLGGAADADAAVAQTRPLGSLDQTDPAPGAPREDPARCATATPLRRGDKLDHFIVLDRLGAGGMGVVVSAYDPDLDRKVAIKILRPDVWSPDGAALGEQRLVREARAMAKLTDPNVVTVYEVGTVDERLFVAMEYVDGRSLKQWLHGESRDWREVLGAFRAAGRGLAAAHDAGLVHRDFKPDNVLVRWDGHVQVTDFGLVGSRGDPSQGAADLSRLGHAMAVNHATRTGTIMGTPAYMAPEQHRGEPADERADQFAFCVALYEGLYGRRPFEGKTLETVRDNVLAGCVLPPPKNTKVPAWVHAITMRGLAVDPDDRFPSMEALLTAMDDDPAIRRRRRAGVAGVVALGAVAAFGLVRGTGGDDGPRCEVSAGALAGVWDDGVRAEMRASFAGTELPYAPVVFARTAELLDDYTDAWHAMRADACRATHVRGEQSGELLDLRMQCLDRRLAGVRALTRQLVEHADAKVLDAAIAAVAGLDDLDGCADADALRSAVPPPADAEERMRVDALRARLEEASAAERLGRYEQGLAAANQVLAALDERDYPPLRAEALFWVGLLSTRTGAHDAARDHLFAAADAVADSGDHELQSLIWNELLYVIGYEQNDYDEAVALSRFAKIAAAWAGDAALPRIRLLIALGNVAHAAAKYDAAASYYEEALTLADGDDESDLSTRTILLNNLGTLRFSQGEYADAIPYLEQALAARERLLGPEHPEVAISLNNIGLLQNALGKFAEAEASHERALAIRQKVLGPEHLDTATSAHNLGSTLHAQHRYDEAREQFERALAIREPRIPDSPLLAGTLNGIGTVAKAQSDLDAAHAHYEKALSVLETAQGPDHPNVALVLNNLGNLANARGNHDQAEAYFERALAITRNAHGGEHPDVARILFNIGTVHEAAGDARKARRFYTQALRQRERLLGADHAAVGRTLTGLGNAELDLDDNRAALARFERAVEILEGAHGSDHVALVPALLGHGTAMLELGRPADAIGPLERAAKLAEDAGEGGGEALAQSRFALARALWDGGGDRARAVELANRARDGYRALGEEGDESRAEIDAWLRSHSE